MSRPLDQGRGERWACIMAGGMGKRFWPLSRRATPKHLIPVVGSSTLLRQTAQRLAPFVGWDRLVVVTTSDQAEAVRAQVPEVEPWRMVVEPVGRNTAACVGLVARWFISRGWSDHVVGFFPSDHVVQDRDAFQACLERGWALAEDGHVVVFGVVPSGPETGYGYIKAGCILRADPPQVYRVEGFHEKPSRELAEAWVASGDYLWNSGMFVGRIGEIWRELERFLPDTAQVLKEIRVDDSPHTWADLYRGLPSTSLDEGVWEKSDRLTMVRACFGWDDVGSWEAASQYWPLAEGDNRAAGAPVAFVDCRGCRVRTEGVLVAMVGLEDVVVVQTGDAVLVCHRSRAQEVKALVERLERQGDHAYL